MSILIPFRSRFSSWLGEEGAGGRGIYRWEGGEGLSAGTVLVMAPDSWLTAFPRRVLRVGDVVREEVAMNHGQLTTDVGLWTCEEARAGEF